METPDDVYAYAFLAPSSDASATRWPHIIMEMKDGINPGYLDDKSPVLTLCPRITRDLPLSQRLTTPPAPRRGKKKEERE